MKHDHVFGLKTARQAGGRFAHGCSKMVSRGFLHRNFLDASGLSVSSILISLSRISAADAEFSAIPRAETNLRDCFFAVERVPSFDKSNKESPAIASRVRRVSGVDLVGNKEHDESCRQ